VCGLGTTESDDSLMQNGSEAFPLSGVRVVDLSSGLPGGYCTKLLADGGAEVVKLESSAGDALRRWSASGTELEENDDGALFQFLAASKASVVLDPSVPVDMEVARALIAGADIVVWSYGSALAELDALRPNALRALVPAAVIVAITPFGLEGPWADLPATEFTLQAWAGGVLERGVPERAPVSIGGRTGEWAAAVTAATAALASYQRAVRSGQGELLDASIFESMVLTQTTFPVTKFDLRGGPLYVRGKNLPDIHATRDGYVGFMPATGQQWLDFAATIERPDWTDEKFIRIEYRRRHRDEMLPVIDSWCAAHTTSEIVELASLFRVPVGEVGNGTILPGLDHLVENHWYVKNPRSGFIQPDVGYTLTKGGGRRPFAPAPRLGESNEAYRSGMWQTSRPEQRSVGRVHLPYTGVRVLDFTMFWAGPIVANVLGMLGADVIKIESTTRPDSMRYNSVRSIDEPQFWEWSSNFRGTNTNKRGITLDMDSGAGQALCRKLIATADVIVENFTPRVFERWGLTYDEIEKINPSAILLRMSAFGTSGPWRDRSGYAQTMEQISGLAWLCGYSDEPPQVLNGFCDPIGGLHSLFALQLALEHRRRHGAGMLVEAPQIGGALNIAAEQVIEASAYGAFLARDGNHGPVSAPQNIYAAADGEDAWVAVAVETDAHWHALVRVLGSPAWAQEPRLASSAGRREAQDVIDGELTAWCQSLISDEIIGRLLAAGVPAAKVVPPYEQAENPQLAARGWWETLDNAAVGPVRYGGFPVRFSSGPSKVQHRSAPTLGEHNVEILSELGVTADAIAKLESDGIIGTVPSGFKAAF
jgi:crotonobetainyl-CoA:carnitine CoA-transferase CaiB-like acyl-CoA transferase